MDSFLGIVAADLYRRMGGDLSRVAVVFPGKRAALFFDECLSRQTDAPLWSPSYISISELFRSLSGKELGDPVKLVCELYKAFRRHTGTKETLDDFYFWGKKLLSDFNDADKNMADTDRLFGNLRELQELTDTASWLDEKQAAALSQFFRNFSMERQTTLKERFVAMWDALGPVYHDFRHALSEQGIAYEGMLYREAVERLSPAELPYDKYVFVGFNVLTRVEHRLMRKLKEAGKALFYWDTDRFYMDSPNHEAAEFLRRNVRDFKSPLPPEMFDTLRHYKKIQYVETFTENAQARFLPQWLADNLTEPERDTAVVLCDEALLQPVLHSLPAGVRHANITMGFPLSQTPVCGFVSAVLEAHTAGYNPATHRFRLSRIAALLRHPYMRRISPHSAGLERRLTAQNRFFPQARELWADDEALAKVFTPIDGDNTVLCRLLSWALEQVAITYRAKAADEDALDQLYRESLFKAYTTVNRFRTLIEDGSLDVSPSTLCRLLESELSGTSIPFHGEPAEGLQIMGVLETRNLDFRHVVLLSVEEGNLPKTEGDISLIPHNIRKAFGMTTVEHRIAMYAYYFYRLLQRAERVTVLYNTGTDGRSKGEWSRFLLQMLVEWPHGIERIQLTTRQEASETRPIEVQKTQEVMQRLLARYDTTLRPDACLSPSALNCYLDCRLKFYYHYVANLSPSDEATDEVDAAMFGSIFHRTAENIYMEMAGEGGLVSPQAVEAWLADEGKLRRSVEEAFRTLFFKAGEGEKPEYNGLQLINREVLLRYIRQLLRHDLRHAPFTYVAAERMVKEDVDVDIPSQPTLHTRIGGIIDRMDSKDGTLRIVDYKTGGREGTLYSLSSLFEPGEARSGYIFQTFLYSAIMCRQHPDARIEPCLLYIHRAASDDYSPTIAMGAPHQPKVPVENFRPLEEDFRQLLHKLLAEIFNPAEPFTQTATGRKCGYCDFRALCQR